MATVFHIAEVAAILTIAYALGWVLGYFAHQLAASRPVPAFAGVPAERLAAVTGTAEAAAAAAVVVPVTVEPVAAPQPEVVAETAPEPEPVAPVEAAPVVVDAPVIEPAVVEPPAVEPVVAMTPVVVEPPVAATTPEPVVAAPPPVPAPPPIETTTAAPPPPPPPRPKTVLPPMDIPEFTVPPPLRVEPIAPAPKPAPIVKPAPEPEVPFTATAAARPGVAWTGEIRGRAAPVTGTTPAPAKPKTVFDEPPIEVPVSLELTETIAFVAEPTVTESLELESSTAAVETLVPTPTPSTPAPVHDEDAAMRAIEGGWSRVRARALPDAPESTDVGAAIAAAQTAVEQVLARAGIDAEASQRASKPTGLPRPRDGRRDDLKQISGLGPLDEATLNNLGVYHFDQIAGWDEAQVLWMENHVFARGRIAREGWQSQAKSLASATA